ncbi:MAG: tRNA pseudouridine(55) synthase TruB [Spirochaetaceae bacterium]|nr:MAG: tRNA pseudouridine(55) synthase TruB [Spirochaetaceae bacterium]
MTELMTNGILLLNKPAGLSSARVLNPLKRLLETRKIGHTGTLDPFASGLLVLMVNGATRLASRFTALDKEYEAIVRFGEETDTLDPEGLVIATADPPTPEAVEEAIPRFTGAIQQIPPAYSAIHIEGERAYARARRGERVEIPARTVRIHSLSMIPLDPHRYRMIVRCGSGTYIRSLARDVARSAGSVASLETLRRTSVGPFRESEAREIPEDRPPQLLSVRDALKRLGPLTEIVASPEQELLIGNGRELDSAPLRPILREMEKRGEIALILSEAGSELALCECSEGKWSYRVVFPR